MGRSIDDHGPVARSAPELQGIRRDGRATARAFAAAISAFAISADGSVVVGKSRRSFFARKLDVDVVLEVAEHLPDNVALITRSANTPHLGKR